MATAALNDTDDIRRQMAKIRRELHEDVREVVATAEAATDWHRYIGMYPWVSLGVAFAVGFVIVPRRHHAVALDVATLGDVAKVRDVVESKLEAKEPKAEKGLIGAAFAMLSPLVIRAAQGYALNYFESWLAQQQQAMPGSKPPEPAQRPPVTPGSGPGWPGSTGRL